MVHFYYSLAQGDFAWRTLYCQQSLRQTPKSTTATLVQKVLAWLEYATEWHWSGQFTASCEFGSMNIESSSPVFLALKTGKVQHRLLNLSVIKIPVLFIGRLHDVQLVRAKRTVSLFTFWSLEQPRGYLQTIGSPVLYPGTYFLIT